MTKPLSKRLNFRIDETTYDAFEAKVSAANLTRSEFFRDIILNNRTQVVARKITTDHTKQALFKLDFLISFIFSWMVFFLKTFFDKTTEIEKL